MAISGRRGGLSASLIAGSEELYDFYCQPCSHDNQHLPAEGYCVDCKEYLCGTCFKYHRKISAVRHHVLLDKNKMPRDKLPTKTNIKDVCTDQCPDHQGKTIEYYCKQHDQLGCSACMTVNHRGCKGVGYIPNISDGIEKTRDFIHLKQKLNDLEQAEEKIETKANENSTLVETISNEATSEIGKFINEIKDLFDTLKNAMTDEVKVIRDEDMATMNFISDECDSIRSDITSMTSDLDSQQKSKQNSQLFVTMKKSEKEIKLIEDKLNRINAENKVRQYKFVPEKQITDLMTKLKQLGHLSLCQEETPQIERSTTLSMQQETALDVSRTSKASSADPQNPSQIKNKDGIIAKVSSALGVPKVSEAQSNTLINEAKHREAHHIKDINVKSDTDKNTPDITGLALLHDGRLAAADYSNCCIKIIDIKNNKIISHKTSIQPWDITEVSNGQVAATCYNNVIFFTVSKTPYKSHAIQVDGHSYGIQCHQGRLIVSFDNPVAKVEIMKTNGTVIQRFTPHSSGEPLFKWPNNLTVSPDGNTIYVSERCNDKVVSLTLDGQVKHIFRMNHPTGLVSDKYGLVYVCGYHSNNVTVLTPDLNQAQELLVDRDGLTHPYSITYCDKEDKLYVGMDDSNFVKVFQLK